MVIYPQPLPNYVNFMLEDNNAKRQKHKKMRVITVLYSEQFLSISKSSSKPCLLIAAQDSVVWMKLSF